jgi:hypothetical protein
MVDARRARRALLLAAAFGMALCAVARAAENPFVRVDQDGNVYYGQVVGSASGSRFVDTCSRETIRLESDAQIATSSRHCLDLSPYTGAPNGPPPPDVTQTAGPGRLSAVLVADPIEVVHYDASGKPVRPSDDIVNAVGSARGRAFDDVAGALAQRLGMPIAWTAGATTTDSSLDGLCRERSLVGILVLAAPRLELFDASNGMRVGNLYADLRGYRCNDREHNDVGPLADGVRSASSDAWNAEDAAAAFKTLATSLRRQLIALTL